MKLTSEQVKDIDARLEVTRRATREAEQLKVWEDANRHWREHVKLCEVLMDRRDYYVADERTYGQL